MTLNEVMTQTADAIREKTGKSEKIAPINFAEEIKSISAGGGESGGGIKLMYLDVEKLGTASAGLAIFTCLIRGIVNVGQEMKAVVTSPMYEYYGGHNGDAFAILPDAKVAMAGRTMTLKESLQQQGLWEICENAEITEAEFYDLNA